ncbi:MAG: hypothetical protein ABI697_11495 [Devosia sp.]
MNYRVLAAAVPLLLAGCATNPANIAATYVSPAPYQVMDCDQLRAEAQRVSAAAGAASGRQEKQAGGDAVAVGVSLVLFWPAIFFVGGDKTNAAQVAQLKGEMQAIEQVNIAKSCGIQFQAN